jgi:hypothetical protein
VRLRPNRGFRFVLPCDVTHELLNRLVDYSIGDDVVGEATRKAPAQAELRPTCAGVSRVILPCDVTPKNCSIDCSTVP